MEVAHFDRYTLERRIAVGGMAEVLLAHSDGPEGFQKRVVIKRILEVRADDSTYLNMFLDEARLAARFNHPNLVQVFELVQHQGRYGLVMEYLDGVDFSEVLRVSREMDNPLPPDVAAYYIGAAAEGLHSAHGTEGNDGQLLGVVHRDISPANIVATRQGGTKVLDFGIAQHAERRERTRSGVVKGKVGYMSPEQVVGHTVDRRSDLFSLGTVLYELLTLVHPFARKNQLATCAAVHSADFEPLRRIRPDIPPRLEAVVSRALQRLPDQRFDDAAAMAAALGAFVNSGSGMDEERARVWLDALLAGRETAAPRYSQDDEPLGDGDENANPTREVELPPFVHSDVTEDESHHPLLQYRRTTAAAPETDSSRERTGTGPPHPDPDAWSDAASSLREQDSWSDATHQDDATTGQRRRNTELRPAVLGMEASLQPSPLSLDGATETQPGRGRRRSSPVFFVALFFLLAAGAAGLAWRFLPRATAPTATPSQVVEELTEGEAVPVADPTRAQPPMRDVRTPGRLTVTTNGSGRVSINGQPVGRTPLIEIAVEPGTHEIKLVGQGGVTRRDTVVIAPGQSFTKRFNLPPPGRSPPEGAEPP